MFMGGSGLQTFSVLPTLASPFLIPRMTSITPRKQDLFSEDFWFHIVEEKKAPQISTSLKIGSKLFCFFRKMGIDQSYFPMTV